MRVLRERQGGHATDWNTVGTTDYDVVLAKMQMGAANVTTSLVITFPEAFAGKPLVFVRVDEDTAVFATVTSITTTQATIFVWTEAGVAPGGAVPVYWQAIGPA